MIKETFEYINPKEETIEFKTDSKVMVLESITGLSELAVQVHEQKAYDQDGTTYIGNNFETRPVVVEVAIYSDTMEELDEAKDQVIRACNPAQGQGTIRYSFRDKVRMLTVIPEAVPTFRRATNEYGIAYQKGQLMFKACQPFLYSEYKKGATLAATVGGLNFPMSFPLKFARSGQSKGVNNNGHIITPVKIEFNGPATNPVIENVTAGKFIKINETLLEGEKLEINTEFGKKTIRHVDAEGNITNAYHYISSDSIPWGLQAGINNIKYSADAGTSEAVVYIEWEERYTGV